MTMSNPMPDAKKENLEAFNDPIKRWAYLIWNAHANDQYQYQGIEDKLRECTAELRSQLALAQQEMERLTSERDEAQLALAHQSSVICGGDSGLIGGCGEPLDITDAYRCADCTVYFHRDCANKHFELDAYVKALRDKNNSAAIEDWKKSVSDAKARAEAAGSRNRELRDALIQIAELKPNRSCCYEIAARVLAKDNQ